MLIFKVIIIILSIAIVLAKQEFNIGIILPSDKDEAEIAFRAAVERANVHERNFELIPIVVYADTDYSFVIEKAVCNLITQGVIAIFGPNVASSSDIVSSICNTLDIPHIMYDWSPRESLLDRQQAGMTLNLHPDNLLLSRGIAEIVRNFDWRSYTIVYETEKELQQLQDVLQIGETFSNPTTVRQIEDNEDYRPLLKDIKHSTDNCLILHCSIENVILILQQANELNMLGEYQSIFIPLLDTHTLDLQEFANVGANITTIRFIDPTDFNVKNLVHDWEEHEKREGRYYRVLPDQVKTNMILLNDAVWIFAKGLNDLGIAEEMEPPNKVECRKKRAWPFGRKIIEFLKARSEEASTGRVDFNEYGQRSFFTLRILEFEPPGFIELATWDPLNGLDLQQSQSVSDKRVGEKIAGKTFIITSRIGAPFLIDRIPEEGERLEGNDRYEGYALDLIDAIAKEVGFKYEFRLAPDKKYGNFDKKTQEWNGLVKELLDGNADLGICDLTMTSARRQAVDFTPPFMTLGISILYAKPEQPPANLFSFLEPFSIEVWTYMAAALISVSVLVLVVSRMAPEDWENPHPCKEPEELENVWTLTNTAWLSIGSLMGQGCDLLPKATSTRLVTGMWWFFALMMLNSYTANLAAFLTMSRMESNFKSAEDLAAQSKIKYGAVLGGSTLSFFKDSNFSTYQRMWAAMESARPSVFTKSNDEGVERVKKGKGLFAFFMESTTLEYIIERKCELMQVGGWLDYKTYGIAMPFNSPFRKQISGAVLHLGEIGVLAELKRKWWKEKHGGGRCKTTDEGSSDTPELDLKNVGGVFLVLGIGLCSAIFLGILEFLWHIKDVAVEEEISLFEALKLETVFAFSFWINTKPVRSASDHSDTGSRSSSHGGSSSSSHGTKTADHSHSVKSIKSSTAGTNEHRLMKAADKLRKISSIFSFKSLRSQRVDADELEKQEKPLEIKMNKNGKQLIETPTHINGVIKEHENHHHHHHHHQNHNHENRHSNNRYSKNGDV